MASIFYSGSQIIEVPTRTCCYFNHLGVQHEKTSTDYLFYSRIKLVSLELNVTYNVQDKDGVTVQSGGLSVSPTFLTNDVPAYSESDPISVSYLKYGFQFKKSSFILTRIETLMFMAQDVNNSITLSSAAASALTGIAVDKVNKTITVSEAHSVNDVYDYLQWYQSQVANTDLLPQGELFSTVLGNNYTILNGWTLHFTVAPTGVWKVIGEVVLDAALDLTTFNVTGTLFFAASMTTTFADCLIDNVDVIVGTEVVTINPTGSTTITNNLNATQITINVPVPTLTITGHPTGATVLIHDLDSADPQDKGTELLRSENTVGDVQYQGTSGNVVMITMIEPGYRIFRREYTIGATDATFTITPEQETN